jgi:beta-galactosidase
MHLLPRLSALSYGGDYNPEQWPAATWREDAKLMGEAGITLVTVGVFAWAWLEPADLHRYVSDGGCLVVGPFSGIVDENDQVRPGAYPGWLRDLLGVRVEEFHPLPEAGKVDLDDGGVGRVWSELAHLDGATAQARYAANPTGYRDAPPAGAPALTRHRYGRGQAWYLTTLPDAATLDRWISWFVRAGNVNPTGWGAPTAVEAVRRRHPSGQRYLFLINHGPEDVTGPGTGTDLLTGATATGTVRVPARGVVVLRETGDIADLAESAGQKGAA